ncbi:hypothetical protein I6H46_01370 [Anaerococcus obesiensis]|uniref:SpaA-like prealbumin fold domain-containing protein n=1 Tax=Anaerococcus obesiensis TaxID=1287640 RepID=A0A7T7ZVQ0_9FIRM|nr:SpaA isopeptide-forming pilin-related protein [Anaerococcus obesiensis]QQN56307.1 hypothetical protein I6H46_01370 [Anaerococcus obesiensis]
MVCTKRYKDGLFKYVNGFDKQSQEDGTFGFDHLEEGDYQVQEFNPPIGYKKLKVLFTSLLLKKLVEL